MNRLKSLSSLSFMAILVLLLLCESASAFPRGVNWRQIKTEHFTIVFVEQHREIAEKTANMVEAVHNDMLRFLTYTKTDSTYVVITDHLDSVDSLTVPAARATSRNRIVLLLHDLLSATSTLDLPAQEWLTTQFIYQYSFVMRHRMDRTLRTIFSALFPDAGFSGWMDAGMSLYLTMKQEEQQQRPSSPLLDMLFRSEILADDFNSLGQESAAGSQDWPGDVGLFLHGYSFMRYLSETYGEERLTAVNQKQNRQIPFGFRQGKSFEAIYGKSLHALQEEWYVGVKQRYQAQIHEIQRHPLSAMTELSESGYFTGNPVFSVDGQSVYYIEDSRYRDRALIQLRLADRQKTHLTDGNLSGSFSLSADGGRIYFCKTDVVGIYSRFSDLYMLDLTSNKETRLTKGERAFDPAISPDGNSLLYVTTDAGSMMLKKLDLTSGERSIVFGRPGSGMQMSHPSFSADGTQLALQVLASQARSDDIYLMNSDGTNVRVLIGDDASDKSPVWGLNDEYLFFNSDRSGVQNIFAYSFQEQALYQITNVLTGVSEPAVSPAGNQMALQHYSNRGFDLSLMPLDPRSWTPVVYEVVHNPGVTEDYQAVTHSPETGYRSFRSLFNWPLTLPIMGSDEDGFQLGLYFAGSDMLEQHEYSLSALYGFGSGRIQYDGEYRYNRFKTKIGFTLYDRAEEYAWFFKGVEGDDASYWEREQGGSVLLGWPLYKSRKSDVVLTTEYEYMKNSDLTDSKDLLPQPDTGVLANVGVRLIAARSSQYRYSVSPESGFYSALEYKHYDEALGGDYTLDAITGDLRLFLPSFFKNHVITLRGAGGYSDGDQLSQGAFQLGGYFFEVLSDVWAKPRFYFRGYDDRTFHGDRFMLGSAEYRLPLWHAQRSSLAGLLYWNSVAATAFFDAGDAWDDDMRDPSLSYSAGAEINLKLGYLYGRVPLDFDIGVAQGFDDDYGVTQIYFRTRVRMFKY